MGLMGCGYRDEARSVMEAVALAIEKFGSPIELYVCLEGALLVDPPGREGDILTRRRLPAENRNQGWTAAALMYFGAALSHMDGHPLADG